MTTAIKRRRGTTAQHATFTGLEGELTVDTTKDTVVVHDGATAGGFPLAKESQATTNVAITGGTISGITDLAIADGGTGASTAANARTNLGVTATGADTTYAYRANNLSDLASASTARTNLGLGTVATQAASSVAITGGTINGTTIGATTPSTVSATSLTDSGNLTFTGTGNRITGDFSNATIANRVFFQNSVTNGNTSVGLIPNGTGANSGINVFNNSDPTNAAFGGVNVIGSTDVRLQSAITGTGTYLPLTMYTGGSERLRIDTSGNVGIGTSSPSGMLDVDGAVGAKYVNFSATQAGAAMVFSLLGGTGSDQAFCYNSNSLRFGTVTGKNAAGFVERMRIDSSGNVGIGTSSPAYKLDVRGAVAGGSVTSGVVNNDTGATSSAQMAVVTGGGVSTGFYSYGTSAGYLGTISNHPSVFITNNTERMRIDSSGNVGIGTSAPLAKVHIVGGYTAFQYNSGGTYPNYNNFFGAIGSNFSNGGSELDIWNTIGSGFVFRKQTGASAQTELMRINGDGNVGIGTSSPNASAILDVQSTTKGVRMPNMTTTQKNAISSPAAGLMVFDTTLAKLCVYTGAAWQTITSA